MIGSGGICYKNQKRQWCNRIYGYGLCRKLYSIVRTYRSRYGVLWKSGKTTMWHILQVRPTLKRKLSCRDRSNQLHTIMKTKPDSGMIDHKGAVNVELKIELSWPIRPSANFYEKKDKTMKWLIVHMRSMLKTKLTYHDWSGQVRSMKKAKQENDMIDCIGAVYVRNEIESLWSIWWEKPESFHFPSPNKVRNMHNYTRPFLNPIHNKKKIAFLNFKRI